MQIFNIWEIENGLGLFTENVSHWGGDVRLYVFIGYVLMGLGLLFIIFISIVNMFVSL